MKQALFFLVALVWALVGVAQAQETYVLLAEDFEGLPLGPNVEEALAGAAVWTDTPPAGWTVDRSGVPGIGDRATDGVTEWAGWSFTKKDWWVQTAGDQRRSEFTLGKGTVAVTDPDEWDDAGHPAGSVVGWYKTFMSTAPIDLSSTKPGTAKLKFDSSWRPEYDGDYHQTGNLTVSFDGAAPLELFRWESNSASPKFKNDNSTNETITVNVPNPAGATSMVLAFGLFEAGNDWWWAIDNLVVTGQWSGVQASHPHPSNGAEEVAVKTVLSWTPGEQVGGPSPKHRVLLSDDVNKVDAGTAVVSTQDANSYDATGHLGFSTTYYWRIDEANGVTGWDKGNVWSFTTESLAYPLTGVTATASGVQAGMGPEKTIDGSGLTGDLHGTEATTMWLSAGTQPNWIQYQFDKVYKLYDLKVWNSNQLIEGLLGFGAKSVKIEYSTDGTTWTALTNVPEFAKAPGATGYAAGTTIHFGGVTAKYVKLTINSTWGGFSAITGLSEVRFFYTPVQAREPQPAAAQTAVTPEPTLSWRPGREAASHNVYLGTDPNALVLAGTTTQSSFTPAALNLGTTYYWRIDEVNQVQTPSLWTGNVWSFATRMYSVIDDMENYTDEAGKAIFDTWLDGFSVAENGSQVGYDQSPFAERTIIHGGKQSMPLRYNNTAPVNYSEAEQTWPATQDWTRNGANTLSLYFRGILPGFLAVTPDHVVMNGMGTDLGGTTDQGRFVYKQLTGNGTIIARLDRMIATNGQAKAAVMIRQSLQPNSAWADSLFTPGYGCYFVVRPTTGGATSSDLAVATAAQTAVQNSVWLKLERVGNQFNAYYATTAAPTTWIPSPLKPQTIAMTDPVYIGLAVTSFVATGVAQAEFSSIATTGNVTGNWQSVDLGIAQSAGNTPDTLYVMVKDSAGKSATLKHADAQAVATDQWQQWQIPFSSLTAVNTAKVKTLILGVGDRAAPQHGVGTLYLDDIGFGRSAP